MARLAEYLRRYMWIANVLAVVMAASFLADIVSTVIRGSLLSAPPTPRAVADGVVALPEAFRPDLAYYQVITDRDLFGSHATDWSGLQEVPLQPVKQSTLHVQLIGTLEGPPLYARAIVRDQNSGQTDIYKIGDLILGQAKLILIERGRIVMERNGHQEEVVIYEQEAQAGQGAMPVANVMGSAPPPPGSPPVEVREVSPNRYELDRQEVTQMTDNMGQLMTQARVIPNLVMNKIEGYRIFAITPGSLYEKIGLKDGDVINRVNGDDISSPEKALQLFQRLKTDNYFQIDVTRNGQRQTLTYTIR